jgi:hypothetical protein
MGRMVAFCGLVCTDCTAYVATQAGDLAAQERVAALWRDALDTPDIDVASIVCDGCLTVGGRLNGYCGLCQVRACGVAREVANCARCADYPCPKLASFWQKIDDFIARWPGFFVRQMDTRAALDEIYLGRAV